MQYKLCITFEEAIEFKKMINKKYNLTIKRLAYDYGNYCGIIINEHQECLVDKDDMDKINFDIYL